MRFTVRAWRLPKSRHSSKRQLNLISCKIVCKVSPPLPASRRLNHPQPRLTFSVASSTMSQTHCRRQFITHARRNICDVAKPVDSWIVRVDLPELSISTYTPHFPSKIHECTSVTPFSPRPKNMRLSQSSGFAFGLEEAENIVFADCKIEIVSESSYIACCNPL